MDSREGDIVQYCTSSKREKNKEKGVEQVFHYAVVVCPADVMSTVLAFLRINLWSEVPHYSRSVCR